MRVRVTHSIGDLASDLAKIPRLVQRDARDAVRHAAMTGNLIAKTSAKRTAGAHGKHYHKAFTWDQPRASLFGGAGWSAEYGPLPGRRQGGMSFEEGSRNQPPHNDLERSRNLAVGLLAQDIRKAMNAWFWPR